MNSPTAQPKNPALEEAISKFDTMADMATALGLSSYRVIQEWRRQGRVPAEHCPKIERACGVLCEGLNDRVDWAFVRSSGARAAEGA
ncbi:YdaS family helix-turn-helix protein [Trinickia dinghuensis]|uniref:Cro/Cl family transcriptional regulator n=1 Tax=Trinickia dinghuensis TaxID=2291023 RepID=A0A3D8K2S5_9BURK|nr:YdaS family helix-turn-helix protein [Trinickia dinghuensis]RDU99196.1 Cro/Cl family transcriptional regulator [Trinickia dinghuensis]